MVWALIGFPFGLIPGFSCKIHWGRFVRMRSIAMLLLVTLAVSCARLPQAARQDTEFDQLANDFLVGYLAVRPQSGTALGLHEYDGKVSDLSASAAQAELKRLKSFQQRLAALEPASLGSRASFDRRRSWTPSIASFSHWKPFAPCSSTR